MGYEANTNVSIFLRSRKELDVKAQQQDLPAFLGLTETTNIKQDHSLKAGYV